MKKFSALFIVSIVSLCMVLTSFKGESSVASRLSPLAVSSDSSRRVFINDQYSLLLRNHMVKAVDLNDDASLQYDDIVEELYVIVIDEPSNDFMKTFIEANDWNDSMSVAENYRRVQVASMSEKIKLSKEPTIQKHFAGTLPIEIVDFQGIIEGVDEPISYKIAFLEGGKNLYMIMSWTLANMQKQHQKEMLEMLTSFRLVN